MARYKIQIIEGDVCHEREATPEECELLDKSYYKLDLLPKVGQHVITDCVVKKLADLGAEIAKVVQERDYIQSKYEELLSYLPKVPTQPYEQRLVKTIIRLEELLLRVQKAYALHQKSKFKSDGSHFQADLELEAAMKASLNKREL